MNLNKSIDNFLNKTLWIWLPFYALAVLIKDAHGRFEKK